METVSSPFFLTKLRFRPRTTRAIFLYACHMVGRIRRKLIAQQEPLVGDDRPSLCSLCGRIVEPSQLDLHHLVPKSRGGRDTVPLHRICHRQIHALLTEKELERDYPSIEKLLTHPDVVRFVAWVRRKPDGFRERTRKSQRLRRK